MSPDDKRVALVTGAGSGIGRATARAFAREGYVTILSDVREAEGLAAASECEGEGAPCRFIQCDVSDEASVKGLIGQIVSGYGRLDVAFNNAGIEGELAFTADSETANFDRVIAVNVRGVWLCMREELRQMVDQATGGAIVNSSSVAGLVGLAGVPAYVASKHAVIGLTRTAALEYAQQKIRVNAICPGPIETPMLQRLMAGMPGGRDGVLQMEPVGRLGSPDEIASAVVWMCSPAASFMTGHAMTVDGGWTVG